MGATIRLTLRIHRVALAATAVACLGMAGLALAVSGWLRALEAPAECLELEIRFTAPCLTMSEFLEVDNDIAGRLMGAVAALPFVAGVLLGATLVAAELESGTATIAWWLAGSRRRWLLERVLVVGGLLAALLALPAIAATVLAAARVPWEDLSSAVFRDYGARGPLFVARGLAAFGLATWIGLIVGRVVPALTLGGLAGAALFVVLSWGQTIALPAPEYLPPEPGRFYLEFTGVGGQPSRFVDRAGRQVGWDEIMAEAPAPYGDAAFDTWFAENFTQLSYAIPGEKLGIVELREIAGLALVAGGSLAATAMAIERRRPT